MSATHKHDLTVPPSPPPAITWTSLFLAFGGSIDIRFTDHDGRLKCHVQFFLGGLTTSELHEIYSSGSENVESMKERVCHHMLTIQGRLAGALVKYYTTEECTLNTNRLFR